MSVGAVKSKEREFKKTRMHEHSEILLGGGPCRFDRIQPKLIVAESISQQQRNQRLLRLLGCMCKKEHFVGSIIGILSHI